MSDMRNIMESWRRFEDTQKPLNEKSSDEEKGFFSKAADTIGNVLASAGAAGEGGVTADTAVALKPVADALLNLSKTGPVHVRGFARFLVGLESPVDANFLTDDEKAALREAAIYLRTHKTNKKRILSYQVWRNLSKAKLGKQYQEYSREELAKMKARGETPLSQKTGLLEGELFNSFSRFLGAATVEKVGDNFVFKDHYDFNDANRKRNLKTLKSDLRKLLDDSLYTAIRRMAPYRQATGYPGYPVEIKIPIKA